jgi:hypothetical protein
MIGSSAVASTLYPTASTSITYGTAGTTHYFSGSGLAVTGTLTSTGNVTVGNTTGEKIVSLISTNDNSFYKVAPGNGASGGYRFNNSAGTQHWNIYETTGGSGQQGNLSIYNEVAAANQLVLDTSGNLLVGTTSVSSGGSTGQIVSSYDGTLKNGFKSNDTNAVAGADSVFVFQRNSSQVGTIQTTLSATSYNTSSDYRLKENVQPMTGALATVTALKPVTFNWKLDGSDGQGFIAHELQAVVPDCVTGEKDATEMQKYEISPAVPATQDEEGNELTAAVEAVMGEREVPRYQGIDTSFLVATLTAALQEAHGLIKDLTTRITALEAK